MRGQAFDRIGDLSITVAGAFQLPHVLQVQDVQAHFSAKHLYAGLAYRKRISAHYKFGIGAGLSWGVYGAKITGSYTTSTGRYLVYDEQRTTPIWYPFAGPRGFRTDPFHIWLEGVRVFGKKLSTWELSAKFGLFSSVGGSIGISANAPGLPFQRVPVVGEMSFGDTWHFMAGFGIDRMIRLGYSDAIILGVDWRFSVDNYFENQVSVVKPDGMFAYVNKKTRFTWLALKIGYDINWGKDRKPFWMRKRVQGNKPSPE